MPINTLDGENKTELANATFNNTLLRGCSAYGSNKRINVLAVRLTCSAYCLKHITQHPEIKACIAKCSVDVYAFANSIAAAVCTCPRADFSLACALRRSAIFRFARKVAARRTS